MSVNSTAQGLPEEPDLLDEEQTLASIESIAMDLQMVLGDIRTNDGVSRSIVRPIADLLPENVKLNSFTENPTHTNYQIAMESIDLKAAGLIAAAVAAVALLFAKVISWIVGMFSSNSGGTKAATKTAESMRGTLKENQSISKIMTSDIRREYEQHLDERVNPIYEEMAGMWNPFLKDVFDVGPVTRTLVGTNQTFMDIIKKMLLTIELIKSEGKKDNSGKPLAAAQVMSTLNDLEFKLDDSSLRSKFIAIHRATGDKPDYRADMQEISDHFKSVMSSGTKAGFDGAKVVASLSDYKVENCPLAKIDPSKRLVELEKKVAELEKMKFNPRIGADVDVALRKAVTSLRAMLGVVQIYSGMVNRLVNVRNQFVSLANRAAENDKRSMVSAIVSSDDANAKERLREHNNKK